MSGAVSFQVPRDGAPVGPVTLAGQHVRLEPLRTEHLDALLAARLSDRENTFRFTPVPDTRAGMERYIAQALELAAQKQQVPFATIDRRDGSVVGSTRFCALERWTWLDGQERAPGNVDVCEIGWTWLGPRAQRTAINSEAKLLMLRHAFEAWKVFRVTLKTDHRNQASRNAITRLGCTFEGIIRAQQPAADGGLRDTAWFSMLAPEWPEARGKLIGRLVAGAPPK
jgi:RimJ/RimL family protein N-acetyltransferase